MSSSERESTTKSSPSGTYEQFPRSKVWLSAFVITAILAAGWYLTR